jgi:hypothetical protein
LGCISFDSGDHFSEWKLNVFNQQPPVHQLAVLSTGLGWIFHLLPKPVLINHHGYNMC